MWSVTKRKSERIVNPIIAPGDAQLYIETIETGLMSKTNNPNIVQCLTKEGQRNPCFATFEKNLYTVLYFIYDGACKSVELIVSPTSISTLTIDTKKCGRIRFYCTL